MSKNIAKTLVATAQALAKASEDLAKIAKELTGEKKAESESADFATQEFKHSVAGKHASVPQAEAGLNLGTLGMSGKKWMEKNDAGLPIQDYFTPHQLKVRKTAIVDVVCDLAEDKRPKIASGEIKQKCFVAGIRAKAIWEDPSIKDALDKVVAAKVKEFEEKRGLKVARKRKPA